MPNAYVKRSGAWVPLDDAHVKRSGAWVPLQGIHVKDTGTWKKVWPASTPPSGAFDVVLSATSKSIPSGSSTGYATFNTAAYQGDITEIRCRITYTNTSIFGADIGVTGRASGNYYRQVSDIHQWPNSTIDHRIDTYDAASLTEFNNGSATGFTLVGSWSTGGLAYSVSDIRLRLVGVA